MIGLDYLMAGYVHLASGGIECQLKKAPEINVAATDTKVTYDNSKSQTDLDRVHIDTVSPYAKNVRTHVGGLMSGEVSISQNVRMMQETFPMLNAACLYVDRINIEIHINPTIFIASEYPKNSCMYQSILQHEQKHIRVDRMIVNKYTRIIVDTVDTALKRIGYKSGPVTIQQLPAEQKALQDGMQKLLTAVSDQMSAERQQLQQQVDTLEEYKRVQAQCYGRK